jgi:hypothetical protein
MLISTALLLDSNIRNSVCTPAKLPCRRVEVGYEKLVNSAKVYFLTLNGHLAIFDFDICHTCTWATCAIPRGTG